MKIKLIVILLITFLSNLSIGQDFQKEFKNFFLEGDTLNQRLVLIEWEKVEPNNPELFTSYFNYYFYKSQKEVVAITKEKISGESFALLDSSNKIGGYLGGKVQYEEIILQKGFEKINQGIELYPNRLDMRFGKIYVYGQLPDWEKFTQEIIKAINYSSINNNEWTWTNNEMKVEGKDFFLGSMQTYQLQLYNTGDDSLLVYMREIADEILKYYPDHIESLSNLSITYLLTNEYDKGLEPLLKAEKLNPKDYIVLSNIARANALKGDTLKAIEYYEKTIKYGDESAKQFAKQQINDLRTGVNQ